MCAILPFNGECNRHPKNHMVHRCSTCVREVIANIPKDKFLVDYVKREHNIVVDAGTIQIVLDVLDQKLGIF